MTSLHIKKIKKLIKLYYDMGSGDYIEHQTELLQIDAYHPFFISRRSLKHFVESRKKELVEKYDKDKILNRLFFITNSIVETYIFADSVIIQANNRIVYSKQPLDRPQYNIRIVADIIDSRLEICSIHLQKCKKLPQG